MLIHSITLYCLNGKMPKKIFFHFLILCGIWSQRIIGTFADEEINESSDFLVRQKRVISHIPGEDIVMQINTAPHVVVIKQFLRIVCVGNIISPYVAITAAACVEREPDQYQIFSRTTRSNRGPSLNVTSIRRRFGHHPGRPGDGIGLLTVSPYFELTAYCQPIDLHTGPLLPGTLGTVSGWGYNFRSGARGTNHITGLRTIEVPIIAHRDCVNRYRPHIEISDKDICTFHPQRHCGHTDGGAGLVVDNYLVGVFLHSGIIQGQIGPTYPDVFALLQDFEYNNWIRTNLQDIDLHYHQRHQH